MLRINKNETKNAYVSIKDNHGGGNVTVGSQTYEIFDLDGNSVIGSSSAEIDDNGTSTPDIYGAIVGANASLVADTRYEVIFTANIGSNPTISYQHRKPIYIEGVRF